jgi:hypothetical protein
LAAFGKDIINLKKTLTTKPISETCGEVTQMKTSVFDIPTQFWSCGFFDTFYFKANPHAGIKLSEYAKNRDNFEYVKEFNRLNCYAPTYCLRNSITGDIIQVNKGFIMGMTDADEENTSQEENKYSFLASEEFSAEGIDFSDPAALLKR